MKRTRLALPRETIRQLTQAKISIIVGGSAMPNTKADCSSPCTGAN